MKALLFKKILAVTLITLVMLFLLLYSVIGVIILGPSEYASKLMVTTLMETSAAKFVPHMYMSAERFRALSAVEKKKPISSLKPVL